MNPATLLVILVLLPIAIAIVAVPALRGSLGRVLRQKAFLGAVVLLGLAAVGLNAATEAMRLQFRKEAVPLAVPRLDDEKQGIPARLGHWVQVTKDEPLDHQVQEVLGTKEFVFRDYVDSRLVSRADIDWFADQPSIERQRRLRQLQAARPESVVKLAVTYYTGLVDTVPHVPEKCYLADGFDLASDPETIPATAGTRADGTPRNVAYRFIRFQDTTGHERAGSDVAYLFHVNGRYASNNVDVRSELANLLQRYGYFAKIELMTAAAPDAAPAGLPAGTKVDTRAKSLAAFNDLLGAALPEVERCLPDWTKVTAAGKR